MGGYRETVILFGTYNICNGRNGVFESVLRRMAHAKLYLEIFQDTKVTDGIHTHSLLGYRVIASDALSCHYGIVFIFYWYATHFQVKEF